MNRVIEFRNVWKYFRLGQNVDSLRDLIPYIFKRLRNVSKITTKKRQVFWALKDVSFKISRGQTIGLIGPNGSGKTTALKLLCGILRQTKGEIIKKGRIGALIEVGAGFHGDLTGRENIYLNGSIMGMKKWEIDRKFDEIVNFAEVENFVDTPVKRFSSGMYVRLGFSVAAHLEPEILLIDEVLAVGDSSFQRKCVHKIKSLKKAGTTIVFVSHNMGLITNICDKALLLENGALIQRGEPEAIISYYQQRLINNIGTKNDDSDDLYVKKGLKDAEIISFDIKNRESQDGQTIEIEITVINRLKTNFEASIVVAIFSESGLMLHRSSTYTDGIIIILKPGLNRIKYETESKYFLDGRYYINGAIRGKNEEGGVDWKPMIAQFKVKGSMSDQGGFFCLPRKWKLH